MVLCDIPTGVVADVWGRRTSYLLGTVTLSGSTFLYWLLWETKGPFWSWAIVSMVLGLGFTFFSGAVEAWLVDALHDAGYEGALEEVMGRGQMVGGAAKTRLLEASEAVDDETEQMDGQTFPDERLELIFTCCHPALALEAQVALTLRTLGGLTRERGAGAALPRARARRALKPRRSRRFSGWSSRARPARLGLIPEGFCSRRLNF